MNGGYEMPSSYDIEGLSERSNEDCKGITESRDRIMGMLRAEHEATSLPYARMVLAGFSQGGALSLFCGLQMPADQRLAGVLCMSGYLAGAKQFKLSETSKTTPVLHLHGTADPMVKYDAALKTKEHLKAAGADVVLKPYAGMAHTVTPEELGDALSFLNKCLPGETKQPDQMSVKELKAAILEGGLGAQAQGLFEKHELVNLLKSNKSL